MIKQEKATIREALERAIRAVQEMDLIDPMEALEDGQAYTDEGQAIIDPLCEALAILDAELPQADAKDAMELLYAIQFIDGYDDAKCLALIQSSFEAWRKVEGVSEAAVQLATEAQEKLNAPYGYKMWLAAEIIKVARGERK